MTKHKILLIRVRGYEHNEIQQAHGIEHYGRFRDNIIIIGATVAGVQGFIKRMEDRIRGTYQLKVEASSSIALKLLDVILLSQNHSYRLGR